jgi:hypothetical protein
MRRALLTVALSAALVNSAHSSVFEPLWSFLASLWAPAGAESGCSADPTGSCEVQVDNGCVVDPTGTCQPQPDDGCWADPNGRCQPAS